MVWLASLPPRGAWIEMLLFTNQISSIAGRSPHGERGLKFDPGQQSGALYRRSPHGERGLKLSRRGL